MSLYHAWRSGYQASHSCFRCGHSLRVRFDATSRFVMPPGWERPNLGTTGTRSGNNCYSRYLLRCSEGVKSRLPALDEEQNWTAHSTLQLGVIVTCSENNSLYHTVTPVALEGCQHGSLAKAVHTTEGKGINAAVAVVAATAPAPTETLHQGRLGAKIRVPKCAARARILGNLHFAAKCQQGEEHPGL